MQIKIDFIAKLPCKLTKRKNWILASCSVFDVHSQGETETQAKKNLAEALSLFLISCYERGTLDAVLKQCGFKAIQKDSAVQKHTSPRAPKDYVTVPLPFVINSVAQGHSCHA